MLQLHNRTARRKDLMVLWETPCYHFNLTLFDRRQGGDLWLWVLCNAKFSFQACQRSHKHAAITPGEVICFKRHMENNIHDHEMPPTLIYFWQFSHRGVMARVWDLGCSHRGWVGCGSCGNWSSSGSSCHSSVPHRWAPRSGALVIHHPLRYCLSEVVKSQNSTSSGSLWIQYTSLESF